MIKYEQPKNWLLYDSNALLGVLAEAKAAVYSLKTMPYQRSWVEELQEIQLKLEVAGTSKIEGADFTENELTDALKETPEQLLTRSQKQAHAAGQAYRWIATLPDDRPLDAGLICELHSIIVTGADDDHCPPGQLRPRDSNVTFGTPRHRGVDGGEETQKAFTRLCKAINEDFREHDLLIQALVLHYHFAAMHPFLDGNGRTARALEALILQRAGLRSVCFIPMSNYYYDEKRNYLSSLAQVRANNHDLTEFLLFGLKGITVQCQRLLKEIQTHVAKALFRNVMFDLFHRLRTPRKRVIIDRQIEILKLLLQKERTLTALSSKMESVYSSKKRPRAVIVRDLNALIELGAIKATSHQKDYLLEVRLAWPTEITETEFFDRIKKLPKAKSHTILQF